MGQNQKKLRIETVVALAELVSILDNPNAYIRRFQKPTVKKHEHEGNITHISFNTN